MRFLCFINFSPYLALNEYYARDISKKVKSARKTMALNGEHCAGRAPYGYIKDPNNPHHLIIDEETAPIVKRIFEMCADGMGKYTIALQLAKDKILTPSELLYRRTGTYGCYCDPEFPWDWRPRTVFAILQNQIYLGHMVSHKTTSKSFKSQKNINLPPEQWIIVKNTHEQIISQELFDKVQEISATHKRTNKLNVPNFFTGKVFCADCGRKHSLRMTYGGTQTRYYYECGGYRRGSRAGTHRLCTPHSTKKEELELLTLTLIRLAVKATLDVDKFAETMMQTVQKDNTGAKTMARLKKREAELRVLTKRVFEQNALGKIDDSTFAELYGSYQTEQKETAAKICELEKEQNAVQDKEAKVKQFAEIAAGYAEATELTQDMVTDLIEKVVAHEGQGKRGERTQQIDIYFRFIGQLPDIFLL